MKKQRLCIFISLLLFGVLLFTSCETSVFGASPTFVLRVDQPTENSRYMIWEGHLGTVLVDKEHGAVYPLSGNEASLNGLRGAYAYTAAYVLTDTAIEWHTHIAIPKYEPDTGSVSHYLYYPALIRFDYHGEEISREVSETARSEEEVKASMQPNGESDESYYAYACEVGGLDRYEEENEPPKYTELQQKTVDYALSLDKQMRGDYHLTYGEGFVKDGKAYFSVTRSNQKGWASQSATAEGIYHAGVYCYDPETETCTPLISVGGSREILLFDTTHALVRDGNTLVSVPYDGGGAKEVYTISKDHSVMFECADGILMLYRFETIQGTPPDAKGYAHFSYPCTLHVFITPDGRILAEDYDLTAEEKENVTNGSQVTYK